MGREERPFFVFFWIVYIVGERGEAVQSILLVRVYFNILYGGTDAEGITSRKRLGVRNLGISMPAGA